MDACRRNCASVGFLVLCVLITTHTHTRRCLSSLELKRAWIATAPQQWQWNSNRHAAGVMVLAVAASPRMQCGHSPSQPRTHTSETSIMSADARFDTHISVHCIHVLSTAHVRPRRAHGTCESALTVHWLVEECSPSLAVDRHGALLPCSRTGPVL